MKTRLRGLETRAVPTSPLAARASSSPTERENSLIDVQFYPRELCGKRPLNSIPKTKISSRLLD